MNRTRIIFFVILGLANFDPRDVGNGIVAFHGFT